jgi:hypothetical protein
LPTTDGPFFVLLSLPQASCLHLDTREVMQNARVRRMNFQSAQEQSLGLRQPAFHQTDGALGLPHFDASSDTGSEHLLGFIQVSFRLRKISTLESIFRLHQNNPEHNRMWNRHKKRLRWIAV